MVRLIAEKLSLVGVLILNGEACMAMTAALAYLAAFGAIDLEEMRLTIIRRAAKQNLTGFSPKAFVASSGQPANDPWARAEEWRYTGPFTRWNRFKGAFPGFGIASVAFAAYCGYEYLFLNDDHGETGHGEERH